MNIFEGIPLGQDRETLADVMAVISDRLSALGSPRSLCALHLDNEDYELLCDWASTVEPRTIEDLTQDTTPIIRRGAPLRNFMNWKDAFGCMFLLLASETARRNAPENSLWPFVAARFSARVRPVYFAASSYPDESIREAMTDAIRQMGLRHVLDEDDTKQYFVSTCLQFGFTRQGMSDLAGWLVGQLSPIAVRMLRGEIGNMESESFISMWDTLRDYRSGDISEATTRAVLQGSPWVLPEWIDEVLEQATKRLPARYYPQEDDSLDVFGDAPTTDRRQRRRRADRFLSRPSLRWDELAEPCFESTVINLNNLGLTADRYTIRDDNGVLAYTIRTDEGIYRINQELITIPSDSPYIHLSLSDDFGETHLTQQFDLWDVTEDVELFDLRRGFRIDPYQAELDDEVHYGLLISPDLRIEPSGLPFSSMGFGVESKTVVRFRPDQLDVVRVLLDEIEIWNYSSERRVTSARRDEEEPEWADAVSPQRPYKASSSPVGEQHYLFDVFVSGSEVSLEKVRLGNMKLNINYVDGVYRTEPFNLLNFIKPVTGVPGAFEAVFKLVISFGNEYAEIVRTFHSGIEGALYVDRNHQRRLLDSDDRLSAREANGSSYDILLPPQALDRFDDLRLVEGRRIVRRLRPRPAPLGDLAGYGEHLWVSDENRMVNYLSLCDETYDSGIIVGAIGHRFGEPTRILLDHDIEPGNGHYVVLWEFGEQPHIYPAKEVVEQPDDSPSQWNVSGVDMSAPALIALLYNGELMGSHWVRGPSVPMFGANENNALLTMAMLRWGRAPLLAQDWKEMVSDLKPQHSGAMVSAWIKDEGLPVELKHQPADSFWSHVILQLQ